MPTQPDPVATPPQVPGTPAQAALGVAALLSGVTALVAQSVWIRGLGRVVGTSTEALAAVTAVFLGGLGLGALLGGRRAGRSLAPGRLAGQCLLGAALLVLVSPWLFQALPTVHLLLLEALGLEPGPSPWPALLLGLPLLLVPTLLMGAAFPLLLAARGSSEGRVGRGAGGLYALNTLGAALGVGLTVLALPRLGERLTLAAATALEVLAGSLLLFGTAVVRGSPGPGAGRGPGTPRRLRAALFMTGFVGLGFEVAAFRLLEPLTGPHLWGLVLLLTPVLLGLALGGWIGGRFADRSPAPAAALSYVLGLAGLLTLCALPVAGQAPRLLLTAEVGAERLGVLAALTALALLPAMVLLGAAFPWAVRAAVASGAGAGRAAGDLSAANALGAVLGGLVAGFALLPAWGAGLSVLGLGALLLAAGALLRLLGEGRSRAAQAAVLALPLGLLLVPGARAALLDAAPSLAEVVAVHRAPARVPRPTGEALVLALKDRTDARLYAEWFGGRPARIAGPTGEEPVQASEGRLGTVALLEEPGGWVRLRVNGLSEARFAAQAPDTGSATETALGLLPVLLHPAPRKALVIGHGAGWTAEAVLAGDLTAVDVAELDAAVPDMVERWRGHPLAARTDPRARLWITDGRLLLRRAAGSEPAERYDVIASQPSHPWVPGAGHLFTREAYALAHDALARGGVFAQWLNLFEMTPDLLRSAVATFRDAFPTTWLFLFQREVVLLGFRDDPALDPARVERLLDEAGPVQRVARAGGFGRPGDLWAHFTLDAKGIDAFAPRTLTPLVVDDRPALELGLAWRVLTEAEDADLEGLLRQPFPPDFARALPDAAARDRWTAQAIDSLLARGRQDLAERWDASVPWGADAPSRLVRAALARARGQMVKAEELLHGVVEAEPERGDVASAWILFLAESLPIDPRLKDRFLGAAGPVVERLSKDGRVRAAFARLLERAGEPQRALVEFAAALEARDPEAPAGTGVALARLLLAMDPQRSGPTGPAPMVETGNDAHVLELLRADPQRLTDRDTLELWVRLEQRVGSPQLAEQAEKLLDALDEQDHLRAFEIAWGALVERDGRGVGSADLATAFDPDSAEAFELLGLTRLQRMVRSPDAREAQAEHAAALAALGQAWRVGGAAAERRAVRYLAWFGLDRTGLVEGSAP